MVAQYVTETKTMKVSHEIANLVRDICREMILHPDKLNVVPVAMTQSFTLYISATFSDSKRIVGGMGAHFKALAVLVKWAGRKYKVIAEVAEVESIGNPIADEYPPYKAREDWPKKKVEALVKQMAAAAFQYPVQVRTVDAPNGSSNMEVLVSESEDKKTVSEILEVFKTLIRPIGKSNHRNVLINVVAALPPETPEKQPDSADGRFAKAIAR